MFYSAYAFQKIRMLYMNYLTQKLSSHMGDIKIIISLLLAYADKKDNGGTKLCLRVHNQGIAIHTENAPFRHFNL